MTTYRQIASFVAATAWLLAGMGGCSVIAPSALAHAKAPATATAQTR
jgi:hypothetical protein